MEENLPQNSIIEPSVLNQLKFQFRLDFTLFSKMEGPKRQQYIYAQDSPIAPPYKSHSVQSPDFLKISLLGALSGVIMESVGHPIDTIRTRIKSNCKDFIPFHHQARKMYRSEGFFSYFRGFSCTLLASCLSGGTYFYVYERGKYYFNETQSITRDLSPFVAGFLGSIAGNLIDIPCAMIRTRMQLEPGHYDYKHVVDGARKIMKREGFPKLYVGGTLYFAADALDTSLTFGFYELFHRSLKGYFPSAHGEFNLPLALVSSLLAASLTAVLTNPLDVVMTRIQMAKESAKVAPVVKSIMEHEGIGGFFKGMTGRIGHLGISAIVLFPTYELLKNKFGVDLG